jgi:glucans biosynthesis protein C
MTSLSERRHDLDWLRVLGVLLLIPFHVALIFVIEPYTIMYIKDVVNSPVLAEITGFIHMWHMPMLFMIAGAATYYALGFRSAGQYVRERFLRLFVPLLFGIITYVPFTIYLQHNHLLDPLEGYLTYFHLDFGHIDGMTGTFTPAHLWFILYLFVFSLVGLPLFLALRSAKGRAAITTLSGQMKSPLGLFLLGTPLTLAAATGILGDMNPLYYFLIFFYGFILASDVQAQQALDRLTWTILAFGLFAAILNIMIPIRDSEPWSLQWVVLGLIYQMGRWALTLTVLGLGHQFLNRTSRLLRYSSEAAMPFYLLHMTFSVLVGYFVIQLDVPLVVKYMLIVVIASLATLAGYELVRRWTVTRCLFGIASPRDVSGTESSTRAMKASQEA